jgi:hypothetical protein
MAAGPAREPRRSGAHAASGIGQVAERVANRKREVKSQKSEEVRSQQGRWPYVLFFF